MGAGTTDESGVRIATAYMAINNLACIGPDDTGSALLFVEEDAAPDPIPDIIAIELDCSDPEPAKSERTKANWWRPRAADGKFVKKNRSTRRR